MVSIGSGGRFLDEALLGLFELRKLDVWEQPASP